MKYVLVGYYDKDLKAYTSPQPVNATDPEAIASDVKKGILKQMPKEKVAVFAHRQLWKLGVFDDDTGLITEAVPEMLLDCDILLAQRMKIDKDLEEVKAYAEGN